jgi:hypothetical protein
MNKNDTSKPSGTDWARLDAMTDAEIDLSDCPEVTPEMVYAGDRVEGVVAEGTGETKQGL